MNDISRVHEEDAAEKLIEYELYHLLGECGLLAGG